MPKLVAHFVANALRPDRMKWHRADGDGLSACKGMALDGTGVPTATVPNGRLCQICFPHGPEGLRTCSIDGCGRPAHCRGWCGLHYSRWKVHRDPGHEPPSLEARLLAGVRQTDTCWIWEGKTVGHGGYGVISREGKFVYVHRVAHELWVGPIPSGMQVDHVKARGCTTHLCVNPAHLEAVTPLENWRRSTSPTRLNQLKTHCPQGHEYTSENTWREPTQGYRHCRECHRIRQAARRRAALVA